MAKYGNRGWMEMEMVLVLGLGHRPSSFASRAKSITRAWSVFFFAVFSFDLGFQYPYLSDLKACREYLR